MNRWRQSVYYAVLIFASIAFWLLLDRGGALDGLKHEAMTWRYLLRGKKVSTAPVVYVNLDSETISAIGDKPWNRRIFGVLVSAILGPGEGQVVGLDIIFSKYGASALLDVEMAQKGDDFFGEVIEQYAEQVVLASAYTGVYSSITDETADLMLLREGFDDPEIIPFPEAPSYPIIKFGIGRLALVNADEALNKGPVPYWVPAFIDIKGSRYSRHLIDGYRGRMAFALNEPEIIEDGETLKIVDADGWEPFALPKNSEQRLLSFGIEVFLAANGLDSGSTEVDDDRLKIYKDGGVFRELPLTYGQSVEVNWFEGWDLDGRTPHVSMRTVLEKANALAIAEREGDDESLVYLEKWFVDQFKGKIVFVGPVDETLKDLAPTPFNRELVPKVGMHANLFRTLHDEAYIGRTSEVESFLCLLGLTLVSVFLAVWGGIGGGANRIFSVIFPAGYVGGAFLVFSTANFVLPIIAPLGASLTASLCVVILKLGSEEWQRRRIKSLFGSYLSPELVNEMVESHRDPELGGVEAEVTALFSDVVGFSSIAEGMEAEDLVRLMNSYLGAMTEVIQEEGGTLDKYIGDAIVAMFGRPIPAKDHALRASRAAIKMQERHEKLRLAWSESGEWPDSVIKMRTRVGLNTGIAVVGNMGSEVRFNYTMMGDTVNLAARCESGAKSYGIYTMMTAATLDAALERDPDIQARKLDRIVVKGRSEPVEIFELWDGSSDINVFLKGRKIYEEALGLYFDGDWVNALNGFEKSMEFELLYLKHSETVPSKVLAERCREFLLNGAPEDWDGAYRMMNK
ncbi:MAG: adenylate/guanylate cyclase domain-containing protein [Verrucomicrobiota bacterium]